MAQNAIFGLVPQATVYRRELHVTALAVSSGNDPAALQDGGPINGEADDLICRRISNSHRLIRTWQNRLRAPGFDSYRITPGSFCRHRVVEGIGAGPVCAA